MTAGPGDDGAGALTLHEVAEHLGVHYMTVYRYVRTGRLPAARRDGRWRVDPRDVADLEREQLAGPPRGRRGASEPGARPGRSGAARHRARLLGRLLAGDEAGAWRVVESALVTRMTPERVHLDLLAPCLREVGDRWAAGTLGVGGEHVASAVAARLAARLAPLCARPGRTRGTLVIGGPAGEIHGLPITLLTNVLRARGWEVVELGPNTPVDEVVEACRGVDRLRAVGISAGSDETLGSAARTLAALRARLPDVPLLAGGPAVADAAAARRLGADAWAADADGLDALFPEAGAGPRPGGGAPPA